MIPELVTAEGGLVQAEALDHRAHRPVEDEDPLGELALEIGFLAHEVGSSWRVRLGSAGPVGYSCRLGDSYATRCHNVVPRGGRTQDRAEAPQAGRAYTFTWLPTQSRIARRPS